MKVELSPHPDNPKSGVEDLSVAVEREGDRWRFTYIVAGDVSKIVIPARSTPVRSDELWRTTCFEAFVREMTGDAYAEFNFSPSEQWAAYRFESHRSGKQALELPNDPAIAFERSDRLLSLTADILIPEEFTKGSFRLGLSAVIEERDGVKSYWALAHPPGAPDFHHPDCFTAQHP